MDLSEVNEIRAQIGQIDAKRKDAVRRLNAAGLRALGLSVGDRIIATSCGKDFEVEVEGCESRHGSPRVLGTRVKKDGTAGQQSAGYIDVWRKLA